MSELIKISEAASIALHACAWLATREGRRGCSAEICRDLGFSPAHFVKIMQSLARAGLVESRRGRQGGTVLTRAPDSLTLLEIFEAIEGPLRTDACLLSPDKCRGGGCLLGAELRRHHRALREMFAGTSLQTLAKSLQAASTDRTQTNPHPTTGDSEP